MNNYRVKIDTGETYVPYHTACAAIGFSDSEKNGGSIELQQSDTFVHKSVAYCKKFNYLTEHEDLALSVYAKAKRNLDLSLYVVTLELPKKGA